MNKRKKITVAVGTIGLKMLNDTDKTMEDIYKYIEKKSEQEQVIFGYVFIARLLASFDKANRDAIIKKLKDETKWEIIEEGLEDENEKN